MDTAEVSLLISGVAAAGAVAASIANFWLGIQRFSHERSIADIADARSVLAEAAVELHRSTESLNRLWGRVEPAPMSREDDPEDADDLIASARDSGRRLETHQASVRIRFKLDDPVADSLSRALDSMLGLVVAYERRHRGRKNTAALEKREENVFAMRGDFARASADFYEAAQNVAGAQP